MSTDSRALRIAFVGCGGIAYNQHAKAILSQGNFFSVVAVCDPHRPNAERLAERFGPDIGIFETIEDMYEAVGSDLDGVVLTTPHFLHASGGSFFLERGIPVLIEKPVTVNLAELRELQSLEKDGAFVQVGQMQRFDPEALWLKDFVQSDERFGEPLSFDLNIWQNIHGYTRGNSEHWILNGELAGGGICTSVGVHPLDILRFVTGQDFVEVTATGRFDPPFTEGAESSCSALFKMSGGLTGTLHASYQPARIPYAQRLVLFGERGGLFQNNKIGDYAGPYTAISEDPHIDDFMQMFGDYQPIAEQVKEAYPDMTASPFALQLLHFREAILEGRKPTENTLEINFNTIAVLEAIAQSMASGKTVTVEQARRAAPAKRRPQAWNRRSRNKVLGSERATGLTWVGLCQGENVGPSGPRAVLYLAPPGLRPSLGWSRLSALKTHS